MYDITIIGGGPGGVAAGVYAARKQLKTLFLTESFGGQSAVSASIENWIGTVTIPGWELAKNLEEHLRAQEGIDIRMEKAVGITEQDSGYVVRSESGAEYGTKAIVIASGGRHRHLDAPGEERLNGKGVAYCSTCDAPFFRGKKVAVVGGGNSALEAAEDLLPYASEVLLFVRSNELKGDKVTQEKILASPLVRVIFNAAVESIEGETAVTAIRYTDKESGTAKEEPLQGVFVEVGMVPNSEFVKGFLNLTDRGEIIVDHRTKATSRSGIFAAGDVTDEPYRQNNISVGDGVVAALSAYDYLRKR
jgi:alkyl hydroperoxide reductase subunit F